MKNDKLFNIALIVFIIYTLIRLSSIFNKIILLFLPIFIGFVLAYFFYPILTIMNKKIPKVLSIGILMFIIVFFIFLIFILLTPLYYQIINLIDYLIFFIKNISIRFNINLSNIESYLINIFNEIFIISNISLKTINISINFITSLIVSISTFIYFLIDMDKIKNYLKNKKIYLYLKTLDIELRNYNKGLLNLMIISFFEYTIIYYIIGLPNALLLGSLCSLSNLIPFFGGIIVQIISVISSFAISKKLGIFVLIIAFILSIFDSYVLNPIIYSKSNKIHPIIIICSVLISGSLLGLFGILFAIPSAIVIITTYKYLKNKNIQ